MRASLTILAISIFLFSCHKATNIIGTWESSDGFSTKKIIFKDGGELITIEGNKVTDSNVGDGKQKLTWKTDDSKTPHAIDYIVSDVKSGEEIADLKGIYEFLDENTFRVCFAGNDYDFEKLLVRPLNFEEGKTKVFNRIK